MKKSVLFFLTALLSLFYAQTSMAQAAQDALYIFRNDGKFDAFFFGDACHNRGGSCACSASHTCGDERHLGAFVKDLVDFFLAA